MLGFIQQLMKISDPELFDTLDINFLDNTPVHLFWKNENGAYLGCSEKLAQSLGFNGSKDILGCTDFDLCWAASAPNFRLNDKQVIHHAKPKIAIETGKLTNGEVGRALSYKWPLCLRSKKVVGTICIAMEFESDDVFSSFIAEQALNHSHINCPTMDEITSHGLSKRQAECVYYLTKGMSIKQIANILNLSPRTVGHYLEAVKDKLGCYSRAQLISKILEK